MQKYIDPLHSVLTTDAPYYTLKRKILRAFRTLPKQRQPRYRIRWTTALTTQLQHGPPPTNNITASRFLHHLFVKLHTTPEEMCLLHQISWYNPIPILHSDVVPPASVTQSTTTSSSTVSPTPRPASPTVQPLASTTMCNSTVCLTIKPSSNTTSIVYTPTGSPSTVPAPLQYPQVYLLVDLEGKENDWVEIGIIACTPTSIINAFHTYALPADETGHQQAARYSHGLKLPQLRRLTSNTPSHLKAAARSFMFQFPYAMILSADEQPNSDVYRFTHQWGFIYRNVPLQPWVQRVHQPAHQAALRAKQTHLPIADIYCAYSTAHLPTIVRPTTQKINPSMEAKISSGSHCALYDAYELYLHLQHSNTWPSL